MASIYILMIYYTTMWQHRPMSKVAPVYGKPSRPYCHPTADSFVLVTWKEVVLH